MNAWHAATFAAFRLVRVERYGPNEPGIDGRHRSRLIVSVGPAP